MIFEATGIRLKHSACQTFLKKMGMKCRRCGLVPGKAMEDEKQRQAQQVFPRLPVTSLRHAGVDLDEARVIMLPKRPCKACGKVQEIGETL